MAWWPWTSSECDVWRGGLGDLPHGGDELAPTASSATRAALQRPLDPLPGWHWHCLAGTGTRAPAPWLEFRSKDGRTGSSRQAAAGPRVQQLCWARQQRQRQYFHRHVRPGSGATSAKYATAPPTDRGVGTAGGPAAQGQQQQQQQCVARMGVAARGRCRSNSCRVCGSSNSNA